MTRKLRGYLAPVLSGFGEPFEGLELSTTDGDSQGVRGIPAQPLVAQSEDHGHHSRHLLLVGSAVTGDRGLDLGWRVLVDVEALASKHGEQSPARLREDNE